MINRFLSRTGLQPDLKFSFSSFNEDHSNYLFDLPTEFECNSFSPTWLEYKGIKYKNGMLLVLEVISGEYLFGEVHKMLINSTRIPYFVVKPLLTVGFDPHFSAYEVENKIFNSQLIGYYVTVDRISRYNTYSF